MIDPFYYKNGQGNILYEREIGAINWEEKADPFDLETLTSSIQCQKV